MRLVDNSDSKRDLADDVKVSNQGVICGHKNVELKELGRVWAIFVIPFVFS
jgi:hypothetical protein